MKINSINSYSPAFGHISTRTIDMIRNQTEGYSSKGDGNSSYSTNSSYRLLTDLQLKRLYHLTKRASVLEKSVIDTSGNNWEEKRAQSIVVRSHCYGGGDRANLEIFSIPCSSIYERGANDPDVILDTLEQAVEYAELAENDKCTHAIFDLHGWHGGVREDRREAHYMDRFRNEPENKTLALIYENTLALRSIK